MGLKDFGKESQDKIAIRLIGECNAIKDIKEGRIKEEVSIFIDTSSSS